MLQESFRGPEGEDVIGLSAGWADPESFPREAVEQAGRRALAEHMDDLLHYQPVEGVPALRQALAAHGRRHGFATHPEEIVVTTGARQALDLVSRDADRARRRRRRRVPHLHRARSARSRAPARGCSPCPSTSTAPTSRPSSASSPATRSRSSCCRPRARTRRAPSSPPSGRRACSSSPASARSSSSRTPSTPACASTAPASTSMRNEAPAHVIHVESLSKTVAGGLRIGWLAAQGPVLDRLAQMKMNSDLHSPPLTQMIAAELLNGEGYEEHVRDSAAIYKQRRDVMLAALERHLGDVATWTVPLGGHNIWLTFNRPVDERLLYAEALREGVTFLPGGAVQPDQTARTSLRLSFSIVAPERFDEAARRLARALRAVQRRDRVAATGMIS